MGVSDELRKVGNYVRKGWRSLALNSYFQYKRERERERKQVERQRRYADRTAELERGEAQREREYDERYTSERAAEESQAGAPPDDKGVAVQGACVIASALNLDGMPPTPVRDRQALLKPRATRNGSASRGAVVTACAQELAAALEDTAVHVDLGGPLEAPAFARHDVHDVDLDRRVVAEVRDRLRRADVGEQEMIVVPDGRRPLRR